MPFQIIRNDITKVRADAIVNTANPKPQIGSGTDGAIYAAAGKEALLADRVRIGEIPPGQAYPTGAFALNARYIIHTVGPVWVDGSHGEREILRSCYEKSLGLAANLRCKSIAFPLISSGVYGFPRGEALNIALDAIKTFLQINEMKVTLVILDRASLEISEGLLGSIEQYIDEHAAERLETEEYSGEGTDRSRRLSVHLERERERMRSVSVISEPVRTIPRTEQPAVGPLPDISGKSLDEVLGGTGETFQQRLFKLIDASGMDDVTVYKKANIDRKVFSRIRCKADYRPKKNTALAFAIALKLDLTETLDLLARAGITFSPSSRFDMVIAYFITNKNYDIFEINAVLCSYDLPGLGV